MPDRVYGWLLELMPNFRPCVQHVEPADYSVSDSYRRSLHTSELGDFMRVEKNLHDVNLSADIKEWLNKEGRPIHREVFWEPGRARMETRKA